MQLEMLREAVKPNEALQRSRLHLRDILKTKVVGNQCNNLGRILIRESEPSANLLRHPRSYFDVLVKPNATVGTHWRREGGGLADVVEQNAPGQSERASGGKAFEHDECVDPDVAFGMELRRLLDTFHLRNFGQQLREQARLVEQLEPAARGAFGEHFG